MKKRKRILSLIYALIFLLSASWSALPVSAVDYDNLTVTDPIDVIFSLQTELLPPPNGSTANFEVQKDIIAKAADLIFDKYINAKIRVILNGSDSQADFLETSYYSSYFDQTTRNELPERLDSVVCTYFDQYSGKPRTNRGAVYDLILDNATLFKSNDTYVYYFLNAWSSVGNGYPDQFSLCNLDSMVYSEIAHAYTGYNDSSYGQRVLAAIKDNGGISAEQDNVDWAATSVDIFEHIVSYRDDREATTTPIWSANTAYEAGQIVAYGLKADGTPKLYIVLQAHTSTSHWLPGSATSLYRPLEIPAWTQPLGSTDAYSVGDYVTYNGQTWVSTIDNNVWAPNIYGWVLSE